MSVGWPEVCAFRVARQHLRPDDPCGDARALAGRVLGLHAQLARTARSSAALRGAGDVSSLLKVWFVRGTLHLVDPDDLPLFVAVMSTLEPRHYAPSWQRYHGITRAQVEATLEALPAVLDAAGPLTREELAAAVARATGDDGVASALQDGWGSTLKLAAFRGELAFAAVDEQPVRFVRPALGPLPEPEAAAAELARRWLRVYGPGTREELARWFGTPSAAQAGRWIRSLGDEVVEVAVDGEPRWLLAEDVDALGGAGGDGTVRLLPSFDPYVVGGPRDVAAVVGDDPVRVFRRAGGWISPVAVRDGVVVGTWSDDGAVDWFAGRAPRGAAAHVARDLALVGRAP